LVGRAPAALPGVDDGESLLRQEPFEEYPTVKGELPPAPIPLLSFATSNMLVPPRISGIQLKPVPVAELVDRGPLGIPKDCPPGMTPRKLTFLWEELR